MKTGWPTARYSAGISVRPGREGARGALAVDEHVAAAVALDLGDVVGDVVDLARRGAPRPGRARARTRRGRRAAIACRFAQAKLAAAAIAARYSRPSGDEAARRRAAGRAARCRSGPATRVHPAHVVGADLVAEPARAGVDEHGHLAHGEAEGLRRGRVEDLVDALHLEEVVARRRACRPGRGRAGGRAPTRPRGRRRAAVPPTRSGRDVLGSRRARSARGPSRSTASSSLRSEVERAAAARAGRDPPRELVHERLPPQPQLGLRERQREQADAAVDVVADAAGRDDAVGQRGGGDAADREAVALVDVGHRQGGLDDARQRGDVHELLERPVAPNRLQQLGVGEDAGGDAHVGPEGRRNLPERLVYAPERFRHRAPSWPASPCRRGRTQGHDRSPPSRCGAGRPGAR